MLQLVEMKNRRFAERPGRHRKFAAPHEASIGIVEGRIAPLPPGQAAPEACSFAPFTLSESACLMAGGAV